MKYIISENRITNLMKLLISSEVLGDEKKKFKFVDEIDIYKTDENEYHVKVFLNKNEVVKLSSGWGSKWSKLNHEIKHTLHSQFGNHIKITITHTI